MLASEVLGVGWLIGLGVGIAGLVLGQGILRALVRLRVPWWSSVAGGLLALGPAAGLLVGAWLAVGKAEAVAFGSGDAHLAARAGWSLVLFFSATTVYGLVRSFLSSRLAQEELGIRIPHLIFDAGRLLLWIAMVFVVVVTVWHGQQVVMQVLAVASVGTIVVGLALQETLKNFIAGMAIVVEGTYAIGDWVFIGEDEGEVVSITRRTTKLRNRAGDVVTVPNSLVTAGKVRNESRPTPLHAEFIQVSAAYDAHPNHVRDVIREAVLEVPKVLREPPPVIRLQRFNESGVDYEAKLWITDVASAPDIRSDARVQVWYHFRRAGIEIPVPVREVRQRAPAAADPKGERAAAFARLRTVPFFAALPEDLIERLAEGATLRDYAKGEAVCRQGQAGDTCYVVDTGSVAVSIGDGRDAERQVAEMGAGSLFGEMSLLTGEPRSATVRAREDTRLLGIGADTLRAALERAPELALRLAEVATLRKEGLLEARAQLDAAASARVKASTHRLSDLIVRFFRLPTDGKPRPPSA